MLDLPESCATARVTAGSTTKADQFPVELYDSTQNAGDAPGYGIKFSSPVVANGKVYLATGHDLTTATGELDVYGLK
jgi:hypothetical protein